MIFSTVSYFDLQNNYSYYTTIFPIQGHLCEISRSFKSKWAFNNKTLNPAIYRISAVENVDSFERAAFRISSCWLDQSR